MGAGAIGGENIDSEHLSGPQEQTVMECEGCSIRFSLFKRKKLCGDCGRQFCTNCSMKIKGPQRRCSKCQIILAGDFTKQDLLPLRVKDLRFFLAKKNIPTRTCTEKGHLVDLIFHNFANSTHQSLYREHEQHVVRLAERMREAIDEERQNRAQRQQHQQEETTPTEVPSQPEMPEAEAEAEADAEMHEETEDERTERLRQRQEREMQEALHRLAEELQENMNNREDRPANVRAKLSDISTEEDIDKMTVKQLKEVLATNFVNYKGCCEKYELAERVQRLWKENLNDQKRAEEIKTANNIQDPGEGEMCKICMDAPIECVLLECGHMVSCTNCGRRLAECPICRQNVVRAVRIFRS